LLDDLDQAAMQGAKSVRQVARARVFLRADDPRLADHRFVGAVFDDRVACDLKSRINAENPLPHRLADLPGHIASLFPLDAELAEPPAGPAGAILQRDLELCQPLAN